MSIDAHTRNLAKWLNEEQTGPIDRQALARLLAHVQYPPQRTEQTPVYHLRQYGNVTKEELDRYMATGDINTAPLAAAPVQPVAVVGEDKHGPFVDWLGDKSSFYDRHPVGTEFFAASPAAQPAQRKPTQELEALFTNIDHAISSGAWNVQKGSQTWEIIDEAKAAHGIKENT